MAKFDGWFLFSDVDGTISTWDYTIPQKNLDALRYFTENGGKFAVATGRGIAGVLQLECLKYVNMPCVLSNGAVIYDILKEETILFYELPEKAKEMAKIIIKERPELRVMVWSENDGYEIGAKVSAPHWTKESTIDTLVDKWTKIVTYVDADERESYIKWLQSMADGKVTISSSGENFVEIMPYEITKGSGVEHLIQLYQLDRSKVAVIGDFFNDLEMLSIEGVNSFSPENAHEDIKKITQKTLCHVDDGAIAELISLLY